MTIRVIDYVANAGGGIRFMQQLLPALMRQRPRTRFEVISHGPALKRYEDLLGRANVDARLTTIEPGATDWRFDVPAKALEGCDLAWLPWLHRHRLPAGGDDRVVASFHDAILFQFEDLFHDLIPAGAVEDERRTLRRWFDSRAGIAVSSNATVLALRALFRVASARLAMIALSGEHAATQTPPSPLPPDWAWADQPFLLCPANISPHKNHETLLRGVAAWGFKHPLVLSGEATHLDKCRWSRAVAVSDLAQACGFEVGRSLQPLGYVPDETYAALLPRAWALVMPTLAEGGGSFPVFEALQHGVPVLCSDIPVLREQMRRSGAEVGWFDPSNPADLARALRSLEANYAARKAAAVSQVGTMRRRSWDDVAVEYWEQFDRQIRAATEPPLRRRLAI